MSDHEVAVELFYDGDWQPQEAYARDGITLTRGAPGEGQDSPPSTASLSFPNIGGDLSPGNPASPLYGLVGRNTPMRVAADGSVRSTTEIGSLAPDRTLDEDGVQGDAWVKVQGGGILRRLQQGTTPLRAALERAYAAAGPIAYWPLNEAKGATQFNSGLVDGPPLLLTTAIATGEIPGPSGTSGSFPNLAESPAVPSYADGAFDPTFAGSNWGFQCLVYIGPNIDGESTVDNPVFRWMVTGSGRWQLNVGVDDDDGPYVSVFGRIGTSNAAVGRFIGIPFGWAHVRLLVYQSGGDGKVELYVNGESVDTVGAGERTVSGVTVLPPSGVVQVGTTELTAYTALVSGLVNMEFASLAMPAFFDYADADDWYPASLGYVGELAGDRFLRVLAEEGVTAVVVGDETDTQPMGPQPVAKLVDVVRECVRTDDGLLYEPVDDRALVMRTGRSLRNQDPVAVLDFLDGFAPGMVPVFDDKTTRNDVTATRAAGGAARAVQEFGPLNVADPIDDPEGVGRYDTSVAVNPATDAALVNHAWWHLAKGTVDEPRWPAVTIDLDASPSLIATIDGLEIGDRIDVENLPVDWAQEDVALILLGVRESYPSGAGDFRRTVTLNAAPYSPYEVLLVGAADGSVDLRGQRVGTALSTVDGTHIAGDTTILIDSAGIPWSTDADDYDVTLNGGGLFLLLAGELVRVVSVAGAGSAWTLTVARAQNGVSKAIPDGTRVKFRNPGRLGL